MQVHITLVLRCEMRDMRRKRLKGCGLRGCSNHLYKHTPATCTMSEIRPPACSTFAVWNMSESLFRICFAKVFSRDGTISSIHAPSLSQPVNLWHCGSTRQALPETSVTIHIRRPLQQAWWIFWKSSASSLRAIAPAKPCTVVQISDHFVHEHRYKNE